MNQTKGGAVYSINTGFQINSGIVKIPDKFWNLWNSVFLDLRISNILPPYFVETK
jgi:hypothetical protein